MARTMAADTGTPLEPVERNAVFVAIQAAMLAVTRGDPMATMACLEVATTRLGAWINVKAR